MQKKIFTALLAAAILVSMFASCQASTDNSGNDTDPAAEVSSVDEAESDSTSSVNAADVEISDDIFSGQIAFDGHVYTIPCAFSEFTENGWEFDFEDATAEANYYIPYQTISKGDMEINIGLYNKTSETLHYSDCAVRGVYVIPMECAQVILPGNFVFDKNTTVDDIIAQYGEPTEKYDTDNYISLTYEKDIYQHVSFQIFKSASELDSSYNRFEMEKMN